ncbi:MAG: tsaB [Caulobacteraceae bacterium]|nr:tsaB [Caulobacteraceae bacterium]
MLVLALDTCLSACQAALWRDGEVVAAASEPMARGHQERLAPMLQAMLAEANVGLDRVDRIAVTVGPGSFTGLRVGLAFAKGLGLALDKPVVGVTSLEALAASAPPAGLTLALIDARRDQAYWQAFADGAPVTEPQASGIADIVDWLVGTGPPARLVGPGTGLLAGRFPLAEALARAAPDPVAVARIAATREPRPPHPLYLRTPDAKLPGGVDPFA